MASFTPYPGDANDPLDVYVDSFFSSRTFQLICVQAVQLATILPVAPPPADFVSFGRTPMHQWYQALLMEFITIFVRRLRYLNNFPTCYGVDPTNPSNSLFHDDVEAFNREATAHINAILTRFNKDFHSRLLGSTDGLGIDMTQPNALTAALSLQEAISLAEFPPKKNWKVGEPLHVEYRRHLSMFTTGVVKLIAERDDLRWMLGVPDKLVRGVAAYKEYYIACLREETVRARNVYGRGVGTRSGTTMMADDAFY